MALHLSPAGARSDPDFCPRRRTRAGQGGRHQHPAAWPGAAAGWEL